jgi:hypothetical protein
MTRPDDIAEAVGLAEEWQGIGALDMATSDALDIVARALLKLAPVFEAALYWRSEENYLGDRKAGMRRLIDAIDHARTGGGIR